MQNIPMLPPPGLTEAVTIKLEESLKQDWQECKYVHRVDVSEMVREFLRQQLPRIKEAKKGA